jgi:hypothetical protein
MTERQTAADVLMIRPAHFGANEQTAASNRFQQPEAASSASQTRLAAAAEFDRTVALLREAGVRVHVFDDRLQPRTPDSIFPNNWVTLHADGTAVLYPMLAENRRLERRRDILESLGAGDFRLQNVVDLTVHESLHQFLEGTGSLVLDRINRIAYACVSPRTDVEVLGEFAQRLDYELVCFDACDADGAAIYHTNVMMSVGRTFAVVCIESVRENQRAAVSRALADSGREVIELSLAQMGAFAGNMLEVAGASDSSALAMSASAHSSLTPKQLDALARHTDRIVAVPIPTIERVGGGSIRCMLAEIHLPRRGA